ncbi:hypothetical protein EON73_02630, partial [bacterium]
MEKLPGAYELCRVFGIIDENGKSTMVNDDRVLEMHNILKPIFANDSIFSFICGHCKESERNYFLKVSADLSKSQIDEAALKISNKKLEHELLSANQKLASIQNEIVSDATVETNFNANSNIDSSNTDSAAQNAV